MKFPGLNVDLSFQETAAPPSQQLYQFGNAPGTLHPGNKYPVRAESLTLINGQHNITGAQGEN